jgi:hypothetical protein
LIPTTKIVDLNVKEFYSMERVSFKCFFHIQIT